MKINIPTHSALAKTYEKILNRTLEVIDNIEADKEFTDEEKIKYISYISGTFKVLVKRIRKTFHSKLKGKNITINSLINNYNTVILDRAQQECDK